MPKNIMLVLMHHRHKLLDFYKLAMFLSSGKSMKSTLFSPLDGAHLYFRILKKHNVSESDSASVIT
jgi:hypothetical protein